MATTKKQQKMKELEAELRSLIDENNAIEVEKVDRYSNLVGIFYELDKSIKRRRYGVDQKRKPDILKRKSSSHQQNKSKCFSNQTGFFL